MSIGKSGGMKRLHSLFIEHFRVAGFKGGAKTAAKPQAIPAVEGWGLFAGRTERPRKRM